MRNNSESRYDATHTSNAKILHFRDEVESDCGRGDERPERPSDLQTTRKAEVNATGHSMARKKKRDIRGWATCGDRGSSLFDQGIGRVWQSWWVVDVGEEERSEVTASSVFAVCMTDTDWSFSLRSDTGFFGDADSDYDNEENIGDTRTSPHLSSGNSQILQQIDLAAREDSAQYKPNPWSIARINAASRPRQSNAAVKSVPDKPVAKKPPQGAIVDAFKKQAQKPRTTTNSSAQANRTQTPSQKPALTSAIDDLDDPVSAPARSPAPIAHITTSAVHPVPISSQPRVPQQHQGTPLLSSLPRRALPASRPSQPTYRSPDPHFTPNLKRVQPFLSPAPPPLRPKHYISSAPISGVTSPQGPAPFGPHILEAHTPIPTSAHLVTEHVTPITAAYQDDGHLARPSRSAPTSVIPERKALSPRPRQTIQLPPRPHSNQSIMKIPPGPETIHPSPSFAQARRFFEHGSLPGTTVKLPSPESKPPFKGESPPSPLPSRPHIASPPTKYIDPYDQLPPSPDSEWSTLKPPTRKANGKDKSKGSNVKSGKFRLPLTLGIITPKEPPQKKARVVTYLPPPPPKKRKTVAEPRLGARDAETDICNRRHSSPTTMVFVLRSYLLSPAFQNPGARMSGLPSPPPSDETAPPSSPTPSVQFDSNGVLTRYKLVRAKIRQVRTPNKYPHSLVVPFDLFLLGPVPLFILVAEGARRSTLGYPRVGELWRRVPRSGAHARRC